MEYKDFLKGKRVAVVGPSISVEGSKRGGYIGSRDIVVRMIRPNKITSLIPKRLEQDIGLKTDVIYSNFQVGGIPEKYLIDLKHQGAKYINSTRPVSEIPAYNSIQNVLDRNDIQYCNVTTAKHNQWKRQIKCSPHSGFCVLLDLLSYDIKELYILGFSFYQDMVIDEWLEHIGWSKSHVVNDVKQVNKDGHNVSERDNIEDWKQEEVHNNAKELIYFKKVMLKDERVRLDPSLSKLLLKEPV